MAEKQTKLSIIIRAVDNATKPIRDLNARIAKLAGPARTVGARLAGAFRAVGGAISSVLSKIPVLGAAVGGLVAGAVYGLKKMIDSFDDLGDTAERVGLSADALAQLQFAARKSGVDVNRLDKGLENFAKTLGMAKAGTGSLASFLGRVSPVLLKQIKAAKNNEQAFTLLADAMAKLQDPAKKAALAQQAFGDASLAPLLARGSQGIQELRTRYLELAGPQGSAVNAAGDFGDAMDDLGAATDGVKVALVSGFAPVLTSIVKKIRVWLVDNRENIAEWIKDFAERLPAAIAKVAAFIEKTIDGLTKLYEGYKDFRRFVFGPTADEKAEDIAKQTIPNQLAQIRRLANLSGTSETGGLLKAAANQRAEIDALESKGNLSEDEQVQLGVAKRHLAALSKMADQAIFPGGPSLDMNKFADRFAMADPTKFEKYDVQFVQPIADAFAKLVPDTVRLHPDDVRAIATQAKVQLDITGAPRGARATTDPESTASVDMSLGYQMGGAL